MQTLQNSLSSLRFEHIAGTQFAGACCKPLVQCSLIVGPSSSSRFSISSLGYNAVASKVPQFLKRNMGRAGVISMASNAAGEGYASALAELANTKNVLEAVNSDLEKLSSLLKKRELLDFLVNPVILDEKKKSILKTLSDDAKFQEYTLNFLYLLVDTKRIDIIKDIIAEFEKINDRLTDTQVVTVTSAVKLETSQLALIAKKIRSLTQAKNVRLKNVIDTNLIAGFIVRYGKDGSRYIDLSVKGQLDRIAAQMEFSQNVGAFQA